MSVVRLCVSKQQQDEKGTAMDYNFTLHEHSQDNSLTSLLKDEIRKKNQERTSAKENSRILSPLQFPEICNFWHFQFLNQLSKNTKTFLCYGILSRDSKLGVKSIHTLSENDHNLEHLKSTYLKNRKISENFFSLNSSLIILHRRDNNVSK